MSEVMKAKFATIAGVLAILACAAASMNSTLGDSRHLGPGGQIGCYVCPGPNPSADQRAGGAEKFLARERG
jgi:hypothetical protein